LLVLLRLLPPPCTSLSAAHLRATRAM
jgi:hypothetical protein